MARATARARGGTQNNERAVRQGEPALGGERFFTRQFESQEDDRALLVKQRWCQGGECTARSEVDEKEAKRKQGALPPLSRRRGTRRERRPRTPIPRSKKPRKLKKLLEVDKRISRRSRRHEKWKASRTPLELALRDAVAVEAESVATRLGGKARTSNAPGAPLDSATLAGFDADDRARAIERWLSADGVLDSLYPEEVGGPAEHK